jgi:hypothetical protein
MEEFELDTLYLIKRKILIEIYEKCNHEHEEINKDFEKYKLEAIKVFTEASNGTIPESEWENKKLEGINIGLRSDKNKLDWDNLMLLTEEFKREYPYNESIEKVLTSISKLPADIWRDFCESDNGTELNIPM